MTVENSKPKQLLRPITTVAGRAMNQSQFLGITCNSLVAREKSRVHGAIGFGFAFHRLKNWRESFKPITKLYCDVFQPLGNTMWYSWWQCVQPALDPSSMIAQSHLENRCVSQDDYSSMSTFNIQIRRAQHFTTLFTYTHITQLPFWIWNEAEHKQCSGVYSEDGVRFRFCLLLGKLNQDRSLALPYGLSLLQGGT